MRIWKRRIELDEYYRDEYGFMRGNRPCTKILVHLVITPKYRFKFTDFSGLPNFISSKIKDICKNRKWFIENLAVEKDHIHLLIQIPPNVSVSYVTQIIKGNVSKFAREQYPELLNINKKSFWGRKFFAVSVGHDFEITRKYIENQGVTI